MKKYMKPEIEIIRFTTEDIITASSLNNGMDTKSDLDSSGAKDFNDLDWI